MFCPKCGKDCGDFRFCPQCGTELPKAESAAVQADWAVGMACPHCGGTELKGNSCAFCGAQLRENVSLEEEDIYEIPVGRYRYTPSNDWIHLTQEALVLHIDSYCKRGRDDIRVPFDGLVEVVYERSEKDTNKLFSPFSNLHFYWRADGKPLFPTMARKDLNHFALFFRIGDGGERFFHLFTVLKVLAPSTVVFTVRTAEGNGNKGAQVSTENIDWDNIFQKYSPYRNRAVEALRRQYALPEERARLMVDTAFEPRQLALYETDTIRAIRDANCVNREYQQRVHERIQEKRERRARRHH